MSDKIDEAKDYLAENIGNGIEYQDYCKNRLAGDFACDVVKELKAEREKNEELSAKIERLHDELCAFERVSSMDWLLDHLKGIFKKESSEDGTH